MLMNFLMIVALTATMIAGLEKLPTHIAIVDKDKIGGNHTAGKIQLQIIIHLFDPDPKP